MSPLTCEGVQAQIELYAAGECPEPVRSAVGRHLQGCPACARRAAEAVHLAGLLDLHFQGPQRLRRLHARLQAEAGRRRPVVILLRFPQHLASLAAGLLLLAGLFLALGPGTPRGGVEVHLVAALQPLQRGDPGGQALVIEPAAPRAVRGHESTGRKTLPEVYTLDLGGKTPEEFRQLLREAAGTNRLPPPPAVGLGLEVENAGDRDVMILVLG
jgi:anti-sigma factor RsiW